MKEEVPPLGEYAAPEWHWLVGGGWELRQPRWHLSLNHVGGCSVTGGMLDPMDEEGEEGPEARGAPDDRGRPPQKMLRGGESPWPALPTQGGSRNERTRDLAGASEAFFAAGMASPLTQRDAVPAGATRPLEDTWGSRAMHTQAEEEVASSLYDLSREPGSLTGTSTRSVTSMMTEASPGGQTRLESFFTSKAQGPTLKLTLARAVTGARAGEGQGGTSSPATSAQLPAGGGNQRGEVPQNGSRHSPRTPAQLIPTACQNKYRSCRRWLKFSLY